MRLHRAEIKSSSTLWTGLLSKSAAGSLASVLSFSQTCLTALRLQYFVQIGSPHKLLILYICLLKHFPKPIKLAHLGCNNYTFLYCWNMWVKYAFSVGKKCKQGFLCVLEHHKIPRIMWYQYRMIMEMCALRKKLFRCWVCYTSTQMLLNRVYQDVMNEAINKITTRNQMHHYCLNSSLWKM